MSRPGQENSQQGDRLSVMHTRGSQICFHRISEMEQKRFLNSHSLNSVTGPRSSFCRCVSDLTLGSALFQRTFISGSAFFVTARGCKRETSVTPACQLLILGRRRAACLSPGPITRLFSLAGRQPVTTPTPKEQGQCGPMPAPTWLPKVKSGFSCCRGTPCFQVAL